MNETTPPGWRWQTHDTLASTQDTAIAAARAGEPGRLAILAARQTAGRGSRGRDWVAPEGNLNLSVLLRPDHPASEPGRWALLAGIALHDALAPHTSGLMLKWPNDVLLHGAKLGGVLIESELGQRGAVWVVIGLGANLRHAPDIPGRTLASLPQPAPRAATVAASILQHLDALLEVPPATLRAAWLARAHGLGTMLDVQLPQRRVTGAFAGLTEAGELLLSGHPSPISSGEVFARPANRDAPGSPPLSPDLAATDVVGTKCLGDDAAVFRPDDRVAASGNPGHDTFPGEAHGSSDAAVMARPCKTPAAAARNLQTSLVPCSSS